jgi:hypothetical protein
VVAAGIIVGENYMVRLKDRDWLFEFIADAITFRNEYKGALLWPNGDRITPEEAFLRAIAEADSVDELVQALDPNGS